MKTRARRAFDWVYDELARSGSVDTRESAEYRRILAEWLNECCPVDIADFIKSCIFHADTNTFDPSNN